MQTDMTTSTLPAIVPMIMKTIGGANTSGCERHHVNAATSAHTNAPESHGGASDVPLAFGGRPTRVRGAAEASRVWATSAAGGSSPSV